MTSESADLDLAEHTFRKALDLVTKSVSDLTATATGSRIYLAKLRLNLAECLELNGKAAEAMTLCVIHILTVFQQELAPNDPLVIRAKLVIVRAELKTNQLDEATRRLCNIVKNGLVRAHLPPVYEVIESLEMMRGSTSADGLSSEPIPSNLLDYLPIVDSLERIILEHLQKLYMQQKRHFASRSLSFPISLSCSLYNSISLSLSHPIGAEEICSAFVYHAI
ncbi:unnamed protein product [Protopolystoma xenopodis]|uniref:Uncharacterized protein n=1 Tax=Protopolystoma xenopodis TaxID=117903 RepID=A0A3S5AXG2_9PLAT|nr:unnamed protein product [Protopolystoma xenopodis]